MTCHPSTGISTKRNGILSVCMNEMKKVTVLPFELKKKTNTTQKERHNICCCCCCCIMLITNIGEA
ncbi:hypothetical protein HanIR_Chr10g0470691 [Helianthus annuus]|nr:hypothetical protein HanIR_Chr10g0470691 [Helianthus annuus]